MALALHESSRTATRPSLLRALRLVSKALTLYNALILTNGISSSI